MAWSSESKSPRALRLPDDWTLRRVRALRRDGYRCQARDSLGAMCGEPANQVDHIEPGDDHSLDNLQSLCRWHHARKSSAEGAAARGPRPTQKREPRPNPGIRAASESPATSSRSRAAGRVGGDLLPGGGTPPDRA